MTYHQHRGVALILLLTIIVLGITTALVTQLSVNDRKVVRTVDDALVLEVVAQSLVGYALRQTVAGEMPCPDSDGDGLADPQGTGCADQLGLVPYRTLGLDDLTDSSGASLWYAVSLVVLNNATGVKNSSTGSALTVDGTAVVAVVIAPGPALASQNRVALNVADFLEGINADADRTDYNSTISDTQNDQLLSISRETLWPLVESRAVSAALQQLQSYRTNCGEYPWAATFGGSADSVASQQNGALPLGTALPFDWGAACGGSTAPANNSWLSTHWQDQLFYSMCTVAQGDCITVAGDADSPGNAALVAPGIALAGQSRPGSINQYFEDANSDADNTDFVFQAVFDHSSTFNDIVGLMP